MTVVDEPVALSRMRKAIVRTVTASAMVPQYSLSIDVPLAHVRTAREQATAHTAGVSISDVLNSAVVRALEAHPHVNSSFTEQGIVQHSQVNLAFIVEVGDGMVGPAILDAATKSLGELASERVRLTVAAQAGSLTPAELLSGTFTISNLGTLGVHRFNAMVMPPQAAILAVGAPTHDGMLSLTLTCDHRVIDGAPGARFLAEVARNFTTAVAQ